MELIKVLSSWDMTVIGTERKNERFLPSNMQPAKNRGAKLANLGYNPNAIVFLYMEEKKKISCSFAIQVTKKVEEAQVTKSEIIKCYNKTSA